MPGTVPTKPLTAVSPVASSSVRSLTEIRHRESSREQTRRVIHTAAQDTKPGKAAKASCPVPRGMCLADHQATDPQATRSGSSGWG